SGEAPGPDRCRAGRKERAQRPRRSASRCRLAGMSPPAIWASARCWPLEVWLDAEQLSVPTASPRRGPPAQSWPLRILAISASPSLAGLSPATAADLVDSPRLRRGAAVADRECGAGGGLPGSLGGFAGGLRRRDAEQGGAQRGGGGRGDRAGEERE